MVIDKKFNIKFQNDNLGYLDAFGLEENHIISPYDGLILPDNPPQITHIIGESGSGKSQLCNFLLEAWGFCRVWEPTENYKYVPCCEMTGNTKEQIDNCIYYLNCVGLSDARLYYTTFSGLSDSQKFRASIAYTLITYPDVKGFIIDEFLSTLDRDTAKSIAYLIQKLVRQKNIKVVLSTAHNDLVEYLKPDLLVKGHAFPERFEVIDTSKTPLKPIGYNIRKCNKEEYKESRLGELHYKGKYTGGTKEFFVAKLNDSWREIGFLVSVSVGKDIEKKRRIARVVIHPSYRGIGIGTELVKEYLKYCKENGIKKVSAVSALGRFNPFFEKAGMIRQNDYIVSPSDIFYKRLTLSGFNTTLWFSKDYCVTACKNQIVRDVVLTKIDSAARILNPGGKKLTLKELKAMIGSDETQSGRFLWTLRPRILSKYKIDF